MISVLGIGNAGARIAEKFKSTKNYNVFTLSSETERSSKYKFKLKSYDSPEQYEQNIPNVKKFLSNIDDHVQVFIVGSSFSSNYSLGILE